MALCEMVAFVLQYSYGARTTAIDFPAITVCSNNMFMKDAIGFKQAFGSPPVPNPIPAFVLLSLKQPSTLKTLSELGQCTSSLMQMRPDMEAMGGLLTWLDFAGAAYIIETTTQNSVNSVLGCKWQGRWINCGDLFLNRMTDIGSCFTFYPSASFVDSYTLLNATLKEASEAPAIVNQTAACWTQTYNTLTGTTVSANCTDYVSICGARSHQQAFGTTAALIDNYNLTTRSAGPRSGLQLFLNVQPDQYCVGSPWQNTYGFSALPHDRNVPPLLFLSPSVEIPAGFVVDVAFSVTQITRKTESIGKCTTNKKILEWYPSIPTYSYDACVTQCLTLLINTACNCVAFLAPPYMFTGTFALGRLCTPSYPCYMDLLNSRNYSAYKVPTGTSTVAELMASCECPLACEETQYVSEVSFMPLASPVAFKSELGDRLGNVSVPKNLTAFRKQFAVVNFYFKDLDIMLIVETQAVLIMNVLNGIGGSLGLCLGGSLIAVAEVFVFCFKCCAKAIRRLAPHRNTEVGLAGDNRDAEALPSERRKRSNSTMLLAGRQRFGV
jgi:hypothetical protein